MRLDLKKVFLNENECLTAQTDLDLSGEVFNGSAQIPEKVCAEMKVENHAGMVTLTADVNFSYCFVCDRCCAEFSRELACRFRHILVAGKSDDEGDDYIEAPDYMLDTDTLLRDDILLELPSKFLCKETCKGLCPKCGKNLNEGKCGCPEKEPDPRLAALSRLLEE